MLLGQKTVWACFYLTMVLIVLELLVKIFHIPPYICPSPWSVIIYICGHILFFLPHIVTTLSEVIIGVFLAYMFALFLGAIFSYYKIIEKMVFPLVCLIQIIPTAVLGPIMMMWFGLGISSKIIFVFLFAVYPIIMSFKQGIEHIKPEVKHTFVLLQVSPRQLFRYVLLPSALLNSFLGLRIALIYSVGSAILGEMLGSVYGMGVLIAKSVASYNSLILFSSVYISITLAGLVFWIGSILADYAYRYQYRENQS